MQQNNNSDQLSKFVEICHDNNLKVTPQRVAIYSELLHLNTHPTADEIYQIVKKQYSNISFDTVNRTLLTFAQIGVVDIVEIFGGAKRFDPDVKSHHHLHCIQCGKIFDFFSREFDELEVPNEVLKQFQVKSKRVVLRGICKDCQEKNQIKNKKNKKHGVKLEQHSTNPCKGDK
jgi:Fur family peroxide stress response transcriptional regulator